VPARGCPRPRIGHPPLVRLCCCRYLDCIAAVVVVVADVADVADVAVD